MTVSIGSSATTQAVPIGIMITRESVPEVARWLAIELFYYTKGNLYQYLSEASGQEQFAQTIGNYIHVRLNQMNVDERCCKHCGGSQQTHEWVGGWCSPSNGRKFEAE
jgi:hypothetical protein